MPFSPAIEDHLYRFKTTYRASPQWFKNAVGLLYAAIPRSLRYGGLLAETSDFLDRSQWWDRDALRAYQWRQLKALLHHAYTRVPYYRRVWDEQGTPPHTIQSFDDLQRLPLLTKDIVRACKDELIADTYRDRLLPFNTGGSTGQPLQLYWERGRTRSLERAFMWRQWSWGGFTYGQRTAVLRGQSVRRGIAYFDPIDNHLFLSTYKLSEDSADAYISAIRRFRPVSIQAYPSSIAILASYMKRRREPPIEGLKVILAGSENLYPTQRALLEEVFQCRVYSFYGQAEEVCLAGGCEKSDLYHVYSEYGYTELVDQRGQPVRWTPGARGEIVATGFNNWSMPLIRYRTGDIAVVGPRDCPCGRRYPLWESIEGRLQDYIVAHSGKLVPITAFIFGQHYDGFEKIKLMQVVQRRRGIVTVKLVVVSEWTPEDELALRRQMTDAVGDAFTISVETVHDIPRTVAGKHRFVIQDLPLRELWAGDQT